MQKQIIDKLTKYLGVEPFYPNGVLGETGQYESELLQLYRDVPAYSNNYIDDGAELNCNFNIQGQPPVGQSKDGSSNRRSSNVFLSRFHYIAAVELCKWTNMVNSKYPIDNEDYYLFVRTSDALEWIPMFPRTFSTPRTPPVGMFISLLFFSNDFS